MLKLVMDIFEPGSHFSRVGPSQAINCRTTRPLKILTDSPRSEIN